MTAAELWEKYRERIAEARELDRREIQLSLLSTPTLVDVGVVAWVVPMTLNRLLILESIEHPFLTGSNAGREAVLNFLWIMSPEFVPGDRKAAKKFFRRFWFRKLKPDPLREYLAKEFEGKGDQEGAPQEAWVAQLVDVLAFEYGWSEAAIFDIPLKRIFRYADAMVARRSDVNTVKFNTPKADAVRNEYLREMAAIQKREQEETARAE